jgi:hypothetical protein
MTKRPFRLADAGSPGEWGDAHRPGMSGDVTLPSVWRRSVRGRPASDRCRGTGANDMRQRQWPRGRPDVAASGPPELPVWRRP